MKKTFSVRGVIVPMLTPFAGGGECVDYTALKIHTNWLISKGVHGLMPCGSTGEGPYLTTDERKKILEVVQAEVLGRLPVIAHVGAITTQETIELAQHAKRMNVSAISIVTPYYFPLSQESIAEHFCRVAEAVPDLPVYLYNIPSRTINSITKQAVEMVIARCPNVVGIKDSSGDLVHLSGFIGLNAGRFQVTCGSDDVLLDALKMGAIAGISGNSNVYPEILVGLFEAFWRGDLQGAAFQQKQLDYARVILENGVNLALYKKVLQHRGVPMGMVRPPLPQVDMDLYHHAVQQLSTLQLS